MSARILSNAEIARRLVEVAQLLHAKHENPFKVRAYRRAARTVAGISESVDALVREGADLTRYPGIGRGIATALRELVFSGELGQRELLLKSVSPEVSALNAYPLLDPDRVKRVYRRLEIATVDQLRGKLAAGAIKAAFGQRMEDHFRHALRETHPMLLSDADALAGRLQQYLTGVCGVARAEVAGEVRRRLEVVNEIAFVVSAGDFAVAVEQFQALGGGIPLLERTTKRARFQLPDSVPVTLHAATRADWGRALLEATGSAAHLDALKKAKAPRVRKAAARRAASTEVAAYRARGLPWIPPELREGLDEVELALQRKLPALVTQEDIRGDLHAHTTASDGANSIEEMTRAAQERGYLYLGITDHSQSLRIALGVSVDALWTQIRRIDRLNTKLKGFRILKSAEVDILEDGTLDYPDDLLAELDYTVCSIHSRFSLNRQKQTERVLRAMDHPAFNILGHATGRRLLQRSGYEIDLPRVVAHAKATGCVFEINANPNRLDLSAENVRLVIEAGIKIVICTDAHDIGELDFLAYGVDVARRGGVTKASVLNTRPWLALQRALKRR